LPCQEIQPQMQKNSQRLKAKITSFLFLTCYLLLGCGNVVISASPPEINPLEIKTPDPLLPETGDRALSPAERLKLTQALDALHIEGTELLQAGKVEEAFVVWYRELRLRRALGAIAEVQALGKVGEVAWRENRTNDLSVIIARLQTIQQEAEAKPPVDPALWQALGVAFEQVRSLKLAADVYEKFLAFARQQQDRATVAATLKTLGKLYISWLNYPKAAVYYEELLAIAKSQNDRFNQVNYLQELAYIYDQLQQPQNALLVKQQLEVFYLQKADLVNLLVALKLAIAIDYDKLQQADNASINYQEAYRLALSLQQYGYAGEALQKLAELYRRHEQPEYALQIYQILLQVQEQTYDYYGQMKVYDQMAQIYVQQKDNSQALLVLQKGLELAKSLQYQEDYFNDQIQKISADR